MDLDIVDQHICVKYNIVSYFEINLSVNNDKRLECSLFEGERWSNEK